MEDKIKVNYICHEEECSIPLKEYCILLSKRNQVVLHKLEAYLGTGLKENNSLREIRSLILSVSGDIERLSENVSLDVD